MIRLEYSLTEDDILQFHLYYYSVSDHHKKQRRKRRVWVPVIYLAMALFFLVVKWYGGAVALAVCAVGWFLVFPAWWRLLLRRNCKKLIKEGIGDSLIGPRVLELQKDGIYSSSRLGESKYHYAAIGQIMEHGGYTYVFIGKGQALVLPHDRISQEDCRSFVDEVNRRRDQVAEVS